ncbi:MAG: alpha-galactosidase [Lentisphaerae bacterium]|nr:alpha-galactosidase [Lentisphaerota bacterium]MCP4102023.1 alpha-galactosidase [Lentisphaerota bacterium]
MQKAQNLGILHEVKRPLKIVFLGSGSAFFRPLMADVLNIPGALQGEMALVDIDEERLDLSRQLGEKIISMSDRAEGWKISASTDRVPALQRADYIINCIEVSGTECVRFDNDIPLEYGVDQCIGDTVGPGGVFKALRTAPVLLEVLADVEKYCPNAWFLNYTNPMSMLSLAAFRATNVKFVGLCHSVQGSSKNLSDYTEVPYEEMKWRCAGINHLAWFTELSRNGKDLYPELIKKAQEDAELLAKDPVRLHFMTQFGCFVTESSGHFSEYLPYYRKRPELIEKHCGERYLGQSSFYADCWPTWRQENDDSRKKMISGEEEIKMDRTWEYASYIIEAMETNNPFKIYCTVPNTGLITNLPRDNVAEVACTVDAEGITPNFFGALPPQLAQICRSHMGVIDLAAQACIEKSKELAIQALMLDPLTAAVCSLDEIREMGNRLFEAQKDFLPGFK